MDAEKQAHVPQGWRARGVAGGGAEGCPGRARPDMSNSYMPSLPSASLAVLMLKVLVFIGVVAMTMSAVTIAGLNMPQTLRKMDRRGGSARRCSACLRGLNRRLPPSEVRKRTCRPSHPPPAGSRPPCCCRCPAAQFMPVYTLLGTMAVALLGRQLGLWRFEVFGNPSPSQRWAHDL